MRIPWTVVIPVFLAGLLVGAAGGSWAQRAAFRHFRQGPPGPHGILEHFSRELSLDAGQRAAVNAILQRHGPELDALRQKTSTQFEAIRKAMDEEIKQELNAEQRRRFEAMTARFGKGMPPQGMRPPLEGRMPPPPDLHE